MRLLLLGAMPQLLASTVALSACRSQAAKSTDSTAVAVVARMYQDYSWETGDSIPVGRKPLFSATVETLQRYLDPALVDAVLANRACDMRTQGECSLDFDPVSDSQDPTGATVSVIPTRDSTRVQARIRYGSGTRVVTYRMRRAGKGWRIFDMSGDGWPSLRKMLVER
jgi:hypothetical protein